MASLRCMHRDRQQAGSSDFPHPLVLYLCVFPDDGIPNHCLPDHGFLGQHEELYSQCQKKPPKVFVITTLKQKRLTNIVIDQPSFS